jgi:hypothetical protein
MAESSSGGLVRYAGCARIKIRGFSPDVAGKAGLYVLEFENMSHAKAQRREGKLNEATGFEPQVSGNLQFAAWCLQLFCESFMCFMASRDLLICRSKSQGIPH